MKKQTFYKKHIVISGLLKMSSIQHQKKKKIIIYKIKISATEMGESAQQSLLFIRI